MSQRAERFRVGVRVEVRVGVRVEVRVGVRVGWKEKGGWRARKRERRMPGGQPIRQEEEG